jgi:hypothetical protein
MIHPSRCQELWAPLPQASFSFRRQIFCNICKMPTGWHVCILAPRVNETSTQSHERHIFFNIFWLCNRADNMMCIWHIHHRYTQFSRSELAWENPTIHTYTATDAILVVSLLTVATVRGRHLRPGFWGFPPKMATGRLINEDGGSIKEK